MAGIRGLASVEVDAELARIMGFAPVIEAGKCYVCIEAATCFNRRRYAPTSNWHDARPILDRFKIDFLKNLEATFRLFLYLHRLGVKYCTVKGGQTLRRGPLESAMMSYTEKSGPPDLPDAT